MPSELLAILFKNMIPISNFQLMVLEQNYQMAKESFQSRGHLGWRSFFWLITALLGYLLLAVTSSNSGPESFIQDRSLKTFSS